jgi:hypothetical protein
VIDFFAKVMYHNGCGSTLLGKALPFIGNCKPFVDKLLKVGLAYTEGAQEKRIFFTFRPEYICRSE